jgi:predicted nucleic acid-binding protein
MDWGKGSPGRLGRDRAIRLWQELQELPIRIVDTPVDQNLPELALQHNLSVYDASYLSLTLSHKLPLATVDLKLRRAAESGGVGVFGA